MAPDAYTLPAMRRELLDQLSWNSIRHLNSPVRALVVRFPGLGSMAMRNAPEITDLEWAGHGIAVIEAFQDPWGWMNVATRALYDDVVEGVRAAHGLDPALPLIAVGGSMGGHAALAWTMGSRHRVTACQANCPVCDLPFHASERPDLPRTMMHAYGREDGLAQRLEANSPLHQVARLPDVPYQILHGGQDKAVRKDLHSDKLVAAMRARGLRVEYIEEPEMGHCWPLPSFALHRRLVDFVIGQAG